jgi:hypothetical protein
VKLIHPTDLAEYQTVKAHWLSGIFQCIRAVGRKRRRNKKIQGKAWILRGEITTNLLHNASDPASIDVDADDEDAKIQNTKSLTKAALGAKFEILYRNLHPQVNFFLFFGNLVNILHAGPVSAATKITIQIRGFLQLGKQKTTDGAR